MVGRGCFTIAQHKPVIQSVSTICDHYQSLISNFDPEIFSNGQLEKRTLFEFFKNLSQIEDLSFGRLQQTHLHMILV